jgi:regulator of replication initiation timing
MSVLEKLNEDAEKYQWDKEDYFDRMKEIIARLDKRLTDYRKENDELIEQNKDLQVGLETLQQYIKNMEDKK